MIFAEQVKELAKLEKDSKQKFITGLSVELVRKIVVDFNKIGVNLKKLKSAANKSQKNAAIQNTKSRSKRNSLFKVCKSILFFSFLKQSFKHVTN